MADQQYTIGIGVQGAEQAAARVAGVDSALSRMGRSAIAASGAMLAGGGIVFALQKVAQLSRDVTATNRMEDAFRSLSVRTGLTAETLDRLRAATRGMASDAELLRNANNAMLLGVAGSTDQLAEMYTVSRRLGAAMGVDMVTSLESLITGIGRQSRLWLDNLGIVVDTEAAYKKYADQLGVAVDQLTDVEKKTGFTNETMRVARELVAGLGEDTAKAGDKVSQLDAKLENMKRSFDWLPPLVGLAIDALSQFGLALGLVTKGTDSQAWANMEAAVGSYVDRLRGISPALRAAMDDQRDGFAEITQTLLTTEDIARRKADTDALAAKKSAEAAAVAAEAEKKRLEEVADAEAKAHRERQARLREELDGRLQKIRLAMAEAALEKDLSLARDEAAIDRDAEVAALMAYANAGQDRLDSMQKESEAEEDAARKRAAFFRQRESMMRTGAANLVAFNSAMKGSAEFSKRIMQTQAVIDASKAFTGTLAQASGVFLPPIPQILAGAALAAGLAQVAVIEQQSFARGGVIDGVGGPRQDNIPVRASAGESILTAQATARLGRSGVDALNNGGGAGVTIVVNGNLIGEESYVREHLLPEIERTVRRRMA